jgi:divalent metal cation (Fe/Co/Zn/Cd) transporter
MVFYARRSADSAYPYGYGKAEYFSSAFEGVLIVVAAAGIVLVVIGRIIEPQPLQALGLGTGLSITAAVMNFAVARMLMRSGVSSVRTRSPWTPNMPRPGRVSRSWCACPSQSAPRKPW